MAIVNSLAVGRATKTAGEITYAKVRGRTIARRRIITNKSDTASQRIQRNMFGKVSSIAATIDAYIKPNYTPSTFGSARNHFIKSCWAKLHDIANTYYSRNLKYEEILQLLVLNEVPIQLGVEISGSVTLTESEEGDQVEGHLQLADFGYSEVEFQVMNITSQTYMASAKATLENGIWTAQLGVQWNEASKVVMFLVYVDGKPINNYAAGKANEISQLDNDN